VREHLSVREHCCLKMHALRHTLRQASRRLRHAVGARCPRGPLQSTRQSSQQRQPKKPFVILSLDGGGCRGYMSIRLLERVCEEAPGFLDRVDLFAGTSTGSILAAFLAGGASPNEAASYYEQYVPAIFGRPRNLVRRAWDAKFSNKPLKDALRTYFGDATIAQLPKHFLAPALRVDGEASSTTSAEVWRLSQSREGGWRPAVFSNLPAVRGARPDVELKISDALLRSSALCGNQPVSGFMGTSSRRWRRISTPSSRRVTGTTSRRWRGRPKFDFHTGSAAPTILPLYQNYGDGGAARCPLLVSSLYVALHRYLGEQPDDARRGQG